jgi:large subunit ribosomal protein L25
MSFTLKVEKREAGKPEETRESGLIPGVVYGPEMEPVSISMDYNTFTKLYAEAGASSLIDFTVEGNGEPTKVLIQDIQYNPVKGNIIHVDFRQIKMGEEMTTDVALNYVGEAPAVKELGGTLNTGNDTLTVKCLPKDLVSELEVDISVLATFEDVITIADVKLPEGITILTDDTATLLAKVTAPLTEEQLKAMEETKEASVEDVDVEEKGKEGEEGEGGEEKKEEKSEEKKEEKKA